MCSNFRLVFFILMCAVTVVLKARGAWWTRLNFERGYSNPANFSGPWHVWPSDRLEILLVLHKWRSMRNGISRRQVGVRETFFFAHVLGREQCISGWCSDRGGAAGGTVVRGSKLAQGCYQSEASVEPENMSIGEQGGERWKIFTLLTTIFLLLQDGAFNLGAPSTTRPRK